MPTTAEYKALEAKYYMQVARRRKMGYRLRRLGAWNAHFRADPAHAAHRRCAHRSAIARARVRRWRIAGLRRPSARRHLASAQNETLTQDAVLGGESD